VLARAATVEVELEKKPKFELRSFELDQALKKPKTTVVELRAFERCKMSFLKYCFQELFEFYVSFKEILQSVMLNL